MSNLTIFVSYKNLDTKIIDYIKRINAFFFVKTKMSCQGHFCKTPKASMVYYGRRVKEPDQNGFGGLARYSRFKNPFVILKFSSKEIRKEFISYWIMNRRYLYKKSRCYICIINEKNSDYFEENDIMPDTITVSSFDDVYVSVIFVMRNCYGARYYKNKRWADDCVRDYREFLFHYLINFLESVELDKSDFN